MLKPYQDDFICRGITAYKYLFVSLEHFQGTQKGIGGTSGFHGTQVEKHCPRVTANIVQLVFMFIYSNLFYVYSQMLSKHLLSL